MLCILLHEFFISLFYFIILNSKNKDVNSYLHILIYPNHIQNLNFTGFRKILKKHDKILDTQRGADWRVAHVEVAPFYTCKKITQLISETEVDCLAPRLDFWIPAHVS